MTNKKISRHVHSFRSIFFRNKKKPVVLFDISYIHHKHDITNMYLDCFILELTRKVDIKAEVWGKKLRKNDYSHISSIILVKV